MMRNFQSADVRGAVRNALCTALLCSGAQQALADQAETPPAATPAPSREATPFAEVVVTASIRFGAGYD